jgi:hypothetical protein
MGKLELPSFPLSRIPVRVENKSLVRYLGSEISWHRYVDSSESGMEKGRAQRSDGEISPPFMVVTFFEKDS